MSAWRPTITGLDTRVAARTFAIFCLCAVLPMVLSACIADRFVSQKFHALAAAQLTQTSKNYGLLIFQRLKETDEMLAELAELNLQGDLSLQNLRDFPSRHFQIIGVRSDAAPADPVRTPGSSSREGAQPPPASIALLESNHQPAVSLTVSRVQDSRRVSITAVLVNSYLWDTSGAELESMRICVRTETGQVLKCTGDTDSAGRAAGSLLEAQWLLYLRPQYGASAWSVQTSQRADIALAALYAFRRTLPVMTSIAIVVALLFSVVQIRRSHRPLALLVSAAARIGRRRFDQRVVIDSKDEYERLAGAFNRMSAGLSRQFAMLGILARIDRMILDDPSAASVVERALPALPRLLRTRSVAVALQQDGDAGILLYITSGVALGVSQRLIGPQGADLRLLEKFEPDCESAQGNPMCRDVLSAMNATAIEAIPINVDKNLRGLLLIDSSAAPLRARRRRQAQAFARRFAVALGSEDRRQALIKQAYYDELTGLPNRQLFKDRLQRELSRAKRSATEVVLIYIDLDRFKYINDSLGHSVGDELLQAVSVRLARLIRDTDTIARLGGDEFIVIASNLRDYPLHILAERLQAAFQPPFLIRNANCFVTASFGLTVYPRDGDSGEVLLRNADTAMYRAKAAGGGQAMYFEAAMDRDAQRRLVVEQRLRAALQNRALQLFFQPKINLVDGSICGVEALARWTDDELGSVPPSVFIPVAEECGLIDELGAWALRAACETFQAWMHDGYDVGHISVNASIRQLRGRRFVHEVMSVLSDTGIRASALEIEMTESTLADSPQEVAALLEELRTIGVRIAIDDFGTGYSSMAALAQLPIDVVKIDRSFVTDCATRREAASIVEAVISMAHVLGKVTVAEGVETREQLATLRRLGCDAVQGYLFAKPIPADQLRLLPLKLSAASASAWAAADGSENDEVARRLG